MARPRKPWSTTVNEAGVRVRVYEREPGGVLQRCVILDGQKDRKSLGHRDRTLAEEQARALARTLAEAQLTHRPIGGVTFGELRRLYMQHAGARLKPSRRHFMEKTLELFARHLEPGGRPFPFDDFGQEQADAYLDARRSGRLKRDDPRASDSPRDGTLRNELQALSAVGNWGVAFKIGGRRLLPHNPVKDIRLPAEKNPRRPKASPERYAALLDVADTVDPSGQFRLMLAVAYHTARRVNAICHLRRSDLLLSPEAVRAALAEMGQDDPEGLARAWPQCIRFRAEWDKKGFESVAPVNAALRAEVDRYLKRAAMVGDAWLFPYSRKAGEPTPKNAADWWLKRAEKVSGVGHVHRGGWHAFRRAWASARKFLPAQDVAAAGGWRDLGALQTAYQHADPDTVRAVMELGETGT